MRPLPCRSLIACLPLMLVLATAACDKPKPKAEQADATGTSSAPQASAPGVTPPGFGADASTIDRSHKGATLPAMPFAAPGGAPATLGPDRGKPVLVNLWATWCAPCVKELPTLDALAARDRDSLAVVAISQDSGGDAQVQPFWKSRGFKALTPFTDTKMALMGALKVDVLPTTILFDAKGREVWRVVGGKDWTGAEARKLLAEAG